MRIPPTHNSTLDAPNEFAKQTVVYKIQYQTATHFS